MTEDEALAFVEQNGVVLEAAQGAVPSLAEKIAGSPLRGSWWGHPAGREIFRLTRAVRDSADVLVCRLVEGKVTYLHRSLWPHLVKLASSFPRAALSSLCEVHTESGKHVMKRVPFPKWVPPEVAAQAKRLSEAQALRALEAVFPPAGIKRASRGARRSRRGSSRGPLR